MTDNVTNLPEPGVILDLDTIERPADQVKDPFRVRVGGKVVTFKDPNEIGWQELADIQGPNDLVYVSLERGDREHLFDAELPAWKFNELMKSYYDYYDFEKKIREAQRQQQMNTFRGN